MAGSSLEDFFNWFVRGKEELDYNVAFEAEGLRLETNAPPGANAVADRVFFELTSRRNRIG